MSKHKIYTMSFSSVYPLYISKVERKGRTKIVIKTKEARRYYERYLERKME